MVTPAAQNVVLVRFPLSDLTATKLRPAIVLAAAGRNDWVLCQITRNPYADKHRQIVVAVVALLEGRAP